MRGLLVFAAVLQLALCSCPKGFELVRDGECRGSLGKWTVGFEQGTPKAIEQCKTVDALPIIIRDEEHQNYWKDKAPQTSSQSYLFIGVLCNTLSKKWEWSDGTAIDYRPKTGYNEELDKPCTEGFSWDIHPDGYWSYGNYGPITAYISCTKQLEQMTGSENCDGFDDDKDDNVCYQVTATSATWKDAQQMCNEVGANLASIHNLRENSFVRRLAVSKGALNGVFIGAYSLAKNNKFEWNDGSVWDYENFYPGFPKSGFGDCIAMDSSSANGQWMNIDCNAKLPVACVRDEHAPSQPTCSTEDWEEGQIITSPGYPFSASTPCDYFFAVDAGKKVEVEISVEANSCCDSVAIYDGYLGGSQLVNLTGEVQNATFTTITSNIMRVSWQPNGGVNVKGLAMSFRAV